MGMKLVKFHAIRHIAKDILNFGVPMVVDTSMNEMHWKPPKSAAELTQKIQQLFEKQVATRLEEMKALELALLEILEAVNMWGYWEKQATEDIDDIKMEVEQVPTTGGTRIQVHPANTQTNPQNKAIVTFPGSRMANQARMAWDQDLIDYLARIQEDPFWVLNEPLPILTEHRRSGQIFRGHPNYRQNGNWNDWVLVDWGAPDPNPCHIWCFLDLTGLPSNFQFELDGVQVDQGVYAVVEWANSEELDPEHAQDRYQSWMFTPVIKHAGETNPDGSILKRRFFLANVEAFVGPCCLYPDVGSANKRRYFMIRPRHEWAEDFENWLKTNPDCEKEAMEEEEALLLSDSEDEDSSDEDPDSDESMSSSSGSSSSDDSD